MRFFDVRTNDVCGHAPGSLLTLIERKETDTLTLFKEAGDTRFSYTPLALQSYVERGVLFGHAHAWKYKTGQGRIFQCQDKRCRVIGNSWEVNDAITPMTCNAPRCDEPATRAGGQSFVCKKHKRAPS